MGVQRLPDLGAGATDRQTRLAGLSGAQGVLRGLDRVLPLTRRCGEVGRIKPGGLNTGEERGELAFVLGDLLLRALDVAPLAGRDTQPLELAERDSLHVGLDERRGDLRSLRAALAAVASRAGVDDAGRALASHHVTAAAA